MDGEGEEEGQEKEHACAATTLGRLDYRMQSEIIEEISLDLGRLDIRYAVREPRTCVRECDRLWLLRRTQWVGSHQRAPAPPVRHDILMPSITKNIM